MKVPDIMTANELLEEAQRMNSGAWVEHNRVAGHCAKVIADACDDMNGDVAYVLGLLHDIGRRNGSMDMRHILSGYQFMMLKGYDTSARICLTHSFPYKNVAAYNGSNDCTEEETKFIQSFLQQTQYDDYDRLIQLCDAISYPDGPTYVEKRLVDVVLRKGFNDLVIPKWKAFLETKAYFDQKVGEDLYHLLQL